MKILLVTSPIVSLLEPFAGGTEAFVVNLANQLCINGHDVDVLCKEACETNRFNTLLLSESSLRMRDSAVEEEEGQKLYQASQFGLMDTSYYDVIHYHSYYHAIYDLALLHDAPSLVTLHAPVSDKLALVHKYHMARSNHVYVAVSPRLADEWHAAIGGNISVISNGINMLDERLVRSDNDNNCLFWLGRICPEKNVAAAIQIASHLGLTLKIAGPISDAIYFANSVEPYLSDEVVYLGHLLQADLFTQLSKSVALLATSLWSEPFGLSTLEALACGVPVIGFKTAIPPELRNSRVSIIIDDLASSVNALSIAKRSSVEDCIAFAKQFSFDETVRQYEVMYERLSA